MGESESEDSGDSEDEEMGERGRERGETKKRRTKMWCWNPLSCGERRRGR